MSEIWCDICSRTCVSPATPFSLMSKSWRYYQWPYLIQRCFDGGVMAVWRFSLPAGHLFRWHDYNPATNVIFYCECYCLHGFVQPENITGYIAATLIIASAECDLFPRVGSFERIVLIALAQLLVRIKFLFGYLETFCVCWQFTTDYFTSCK